MFINKIYNFCIISLPLDFMTCHHFFFVLENRIFHNWFFNAKLTSVYIFIICKQSNCLSSLWAGQQTLRIVTELVKGSRLKCLPFVLSYTNILNIFINWIQFVMNAIISEHALELICKNVLFSKLIGGISITWAATTFAPAVRKRWQPGFKGVTHI